MKLVTCPHCDTDFEEPKILELYYALDDLVFKLTMNTVKQRKIKELIEGK